MRCNHKNKFGDYFKWFNISDYLFPANDPWNPVPQNGSGLGSHPDSAFSPLAVTSKFAQNNNNDPWSLGGGAGATAVMEHSIDPFSPSAQKQLQEFDLLREEMDHQAPLAATGNCSFARQLSQSAGKLSFHSKR